MYHLPKNSVPVIKGLFYVILGLIFGLSGLGLMKFTFMKYLLFISAGYFVACGLYYSGIYHALISGRKR